VEEIVAENQPKSETINKSLSVIIPVYNSEPILPELAKRLNAVLPQITKEFEVLLVNDGSHDQSWQEIQRLREQYDWIRGIRLMRNYGQHNALLCGIRKANKELIVTMDDDLQHPPEEISKLLGELNNGFEVVYGTPEKENHGILRDFASQITKIALQAGMGADTARHVSAFRAFPAYLRKGFDGYSGSFVSIDVLLTWATSKFTWIPTKHFSRQIGKSNYSLAKLITHALNMITGFSTLPLQIASIVGFAFTIFGILILIYVVVRFLLQGNPVPGFPFLAAIIAVFSGAQMFSIGIIGEYIARIHSQSMNRPSYQITEITESDETGK
jgi:glycosyltransferase involved in cell wall biosynthesis